MNKKKLIVLLAIFLMAIFISACGSSSDQNDDTDDNNKDEVAGEEDNADDESDKGNDDNDTDDNSEYSGNDGESDALAEYSPEEIEYARIWLQLGDTQDIDELNVQHISSGTPLNPDDETSVDYPEDVVQLTTSRLAEGSITYSSNGDGTITVYNKVPARWDGENPAGKETYEKIIDDQEQVSVDTGEDEKVKEVIKKLNIDS